jgi:hypothetical protein
MERTAANSRTPVPVVALPRSDGPLFQPKRRAPAADPLQMQRAVTYRTTISCDGAGRQKFLWHRLQRKAHRLRETANPEIRGVGVRQLQIVEITAILGEMRAGMPGSVRQHDEPIPRNLEGADIGEGR